MFDKASLKLGLDKAVLQSMNTSLQGKEINNTKQLTKKEIEDLLKKGKIFLFDKRIGDCLERRNDNNFCRSIRRYYGGR